MKPILTRSEITDAVYIVTKYKILEDGLVDTIEKYDVTHEFDVLTGGVMDENARLRDLLRDYDKMLGIALSDSEYSPLDNAVQNSLRSRLHNLGIELE